MTGTAPHNVQHLIFCAMAEMLMYTSTEAPSREAFSGHATSVLGEHIHCTSSMIRPII